MSTHPLFKKNPPNSINGMINGGAKLRAIVGDEAKQDTI